MRGVAWLLAGAAALAHAQGAPYSGHGADSVAREVVAKFAPPPLPARATKPTSIA